MGLLDELFSGKFGQADPNDPQGAMLTDLLRQLDGGQGFPSPQSAMFGEPKPASPAMPEAPVARTVQPAPVEALPPVRDIKSQPASGVPYQAPESSIVPDDIRRREDAMRPPVAQAPARQAAPMPSATPFSVPLQQRLGDVFTALGGGAVPDRSGQMEQRNATYQLLVGRGMDPGQAKALVSSPQILQAVLPTIFGDKKAPDTREFEDPSTGMKVPHIWDGKTWAPLRVGASPSAPGPASSPGSSGASGVGPPQGVPTAPPGVNPKAWRDKYTNELAEIQAKAQANLPSSLDTVESTVRRADALLHEPGKIGNVTGWQGWVPWTVLPSNRETEAKLEQLKGNAFLQAYEKLRGSGAITEKEGEKATAAAARLNDMKQGDDGYVAALKEFRNEVLQLRELARQKAGLPPTPPEHHAALEEARAAITAGADRAKVIGRLKQNNIDATGL